MANSGMFDGLILVATVFAAGAALLLAFGLRLRLAHVRADARIAAYVVAPGLGDSSLDDMPSLRERVVLPFVSWAAGLVDRALPEKQVERIRINLAMAGFGSARHLSSFLAAKALFAAGLGGLALLYQAGGGSGAFQGIVLAAAGAAIGFYLPGVWLGRRIAQRHQQLAKALPDALDLLSISVSAGLGFDGAMLEVVQRWDNPLTRELAIVLRDLKLGRSRRDALRDLSRRTGLPDVGSFVAAVIQADELGTPIKDTLQVLAEQIRLGRRQRAEERAGKATIKMLIPMALFIFPALFVVLLGPAVPSFSAMLH